MSELTAGTGLFDSPGPSVRHSGRPRDGDTGSGPRRAAASGRVNRLRPRLLPVLDAVVLTAVGLAAVVVVGGAAGWWSACYAAVMLVVLFAEGQQRLRICLRVSDQVPRLATAAAVPVAGLLPWVPAQRLLYLGLCSVGALVMTRGAAFLVLRAVHRSGRLLEATLVIGDGALAAEVTRILGEHPELGLRTHGRVDHGERPEGADDLARVIEREHVTRVIVCPSWSCDGEMTSVLRTCRHLPVDVTVVPRLHELGMAVPRSVLDEVWGIPLIPLRRHGHTPTAARTKRVIDLVAGTALLAVLAPVVLGASAVVRASRVGTTFFRQDRITRSGRARSVIKLRTASDEPHGLPCWTVAPGRCTQVGAWLRATHLDELPQLLNVLRGDMSLVGPRPERPCYAVRFAREIPRYGDRHRLPGGMTGWAQVHGLHGDTSIAERSRFDNQYIEYWSPWLDLVIAARTPAAAVRGLARMRRGRPRAPVPRVPEARTPTTGGTP